MPANPVWGPSPQEAEIAALKARISELEAERIAPTSRITAECEGAGNCHGSLKWCHTCGNVSNTCPDSDCDVHHPRCCTDGFELTQIDGDWLCPECYPHQRALQGETP